MNAFFKNLIPLKNSFQPQEGQKLEMKRVYTTVPANFFFKRTYVLYIAYSMISHNLHYIILVYIEIFHIYVKRPVSKSLKKKLS